VVIEERLYGSELSLLAFSDGRTARPLLPARDHKRLLDGDRGPNTGGMGAYAPVPEVGPDAVDRVVREIMEPVLQALARQGTPFVGVLYAGLMWTERGPFVLEFNARFGDPEAQAILPLLETGFAGGAGGLRGGPSRRCRAALVPRRLRHGGPGGPGISRPGPGGASHRRPGGGGGPGRGADLPRRHTTGRGSGAHGRRAGPGRQRDRRASA
jgi:hypothetical protein